MPYSYRGSCGEHSGISRTVVEHRLASHGDKNRNVYDGHLSDQPNGIAHRLYARPRLNHEKPAIEQTEGIPDAYLAISASSVDVCVRSEMHDLPIYADVLLAYALTIVPIYGLAFALSFLHFFYASPHRHI